MGTGALLGAILALAEFLRILGPPSGWDGWWRALATLLVVHVALGAIGGGLVVLLRRRRRARAPGRGARLDRCGGLLALVTVLVFLIAAGGSDRRPAPPGTAAWLPASPPVIACPASPPAAPPAAIARRERALDLLVLGIDGATWDIVTPLMERGRMPHLRRLLTGGIGGVLVSDPVSRSPVVWTTIMTGHRPESHGVDSWEHATAESRRRRPLWDLLDDHGLRLLVTNVPGTWPADSIDGVFRSGFPLRRTVPGSLGTVLTTDPADGWQVPATALALEERDGARQGWVRLAGRTSSVSASRFLIARLLPSGRASRWLARTVRRRYANLRLTVRDGRVVLGLGDAGRDAVELVPGAWSPWLRIDDGEGVLNCRLKRLPDAPDGPVLYVTPLFDGLAPDNARPVPSPGAVAPAAPYVHEGAGWILNREPRLLTTLTEHLFDVAGGRMAAVRRALDRDQALDGVIHVVTLTDRLQHPLWPLLLADGYPDLPAISPYPGRERLTARERDWLGTAIPAAYAWADEVLGSLLAGTDENTVIAVLSDHGFGGPQDERRMLAGEHSPAGIYVLAGGPFRGLGGGASGPAGADLALTDVTPTLLAALGLPVGRDMAGRVSTDLVRALAARGREVVWIPSYARAGDAATGGSEIDEATREQIRSLGYVD